MPSDTAIRQRTNEITTMGSDTSRPRSSRVRSHRRRVLAATVVGALGLAPLLPVGSVSASPDSSTVSTSSVTGLAMGASGPGVRQVQQALIAAGITVIGGADGQFGPMTASALREFQTTRGLETTGTVTDATARALGLAAAPEVATTVGLAMGASGPGVRQVQQALIAAGITVIGGADGQFGPMTASALREFQTTRGLETTGTVTDATARALFGGAPVGDAPASAAPTAAPLVGLVVGSRGSAVRQLQQSLISAGLSFVGGADGIFGPATSNALRSFQSARGLEPTGRVDDLTAQALVNPTAVPATQPAVTPSTGATRSFVGLAPGATGPGVRALQQALIAAGITVPGGADGIFGPATANALKTYQQRQGLTATGRADDATSSALVSGASAPSAPAPSNPAPSTPAPDAGTGFPEFGERSPRVRAMQEALIKAGVTVPGGADGIFGSQTAGAIMTFQRDQGLPVTGRIDARTAEALGLTATAAPSAPDTSRIRIEVFPVQGPCSFADTWHFPRGGGRVHEGLDVIAARGKEIYAVVSGTITHVYVDRPGSLSGNGVRLTADDGTRTYYFYAHLDSLADGIGVGTKVRAGQVLGYNGDTGNAVGTPHLHFEIHPNGGAAVNPFPFLSPMRSSGACAR